MRLRLCSCWIAPAIVALGLAAPLRGQAPPAAPAPVGAPEYKLLVWYERSDPLGTFHTRAYDLRRGQYTAAVDEWLRMVAERYPRYRAFVRDVDLDALPGTTDAEKLEAVVRDQYHRLVVVLTPVPPAMRPSDGGYSAAYAPPRAAPWSAPLSQPWGLAFPPIGAAGGGVDRSYLSPPSYPFPTPVPYPRPHP